MLLQRLRRYKCDVVGALFSIVVTALASLWQPRLLENIQKALLANQQDAVFSNGIWLVGLGLIAIIAGIFNVYFAVRIAQGVTSDLREETYAKIQQFSLANIEHFSSGSLTTRLINDMNQVMNMMMTIFMMLLRIPIILIGSFILAIVTIPRYWWAPIVMVVLIIGTGVWIVKNMNSLFAKYQVQLDRISTKVKENLQGIRVVKSFNQGENEIRRFNQASDQLNKSNIQIGYWFSSVMPMFQLITYLVISLVIYLIGVTISNHPTDVTVISPYVSYITTLLFAIMIGGMVIMTFSRGMVSVRRIGEILNTEPTVIYPAKDQFGQLEGSIEFDNVSFTYPGSTEETLKDISFKIAPHQMVGIVGATGAGKSTLAQLVSRLYDPTVGTVKVGGYDIKTLSEPTLRQTVAFVLQKSLLFSGTIADNLRQGKRTASIQELERAATIARAEEFIDQYPELFNHQVEERSANFSGGQKQRLSIARGVIGQPPILILDDSTSALDAESEKIVQQALEHDLPNTTTLMIAEKISSIRHADTILVLDQGKLVAQGTHEELLKISPIYQEIYRTQKANERRPDLDE
ncbi:ABC transporter ATP-binding protein [Limosilactobacillus sp. Lr3000]|uniref:ABC transporter ATP-binding protein n=1 Tax=Limosilactobacillus albertensis TaxID=2759752 RepID=A0A839GZM7_9LACO|nr:ABC transporter ATP-binding protein [Limosilactobacillus albertensis]